jgi:hypothetical protein
MAGYKDCVVFFFCGMRIYPHTALYERARKEGVINGSENLLEPVFYHSPELNTETILARVRPLAEERLNWIIGSGGRSTQEIITRLHARGYSGPLWEYLIR